MFIQTCDLPNLLSYISICFPSETQASFSIHGIPSVQEHSHSSTQGPNEILNDIASNQISSPLNDISNFSNHHSRLMHSQIYSHLQTNFFFIKIYRF